MNVIKGKPLEIRTPVTAQMLRSLRGVIKPTQKDFATMIRVVLDLHQHWTVSFYCAISGLENGYVQKILNGTLLPQGASAKVIFLIYAQDVMPDRLNDPVFLATFGMPYVKMPSPIENSQPIVEECLKNWVGQTPTSKEVHTKLCSEGKFVDGQSIRNICKKIGFKLSKRPVKNRQILGPDSVWLQVDWKKTNQSIASRLGLTETTVEQRRKLLSKLPDSVLIPLFLKAGRIEKAVRDLKGE